MPGSVGVKWDMWDAAYRDSAITLQEKLNPVDPPELRANQPK